MSGEREKKSERDVNNRSERGRESGKGGENDEDIKVGDEEKEKQI